MKKVLAMMLAVIMIAAVMMTATAESEEQAAAQVSYTGSLSVFCKSVVQAGESVRMTANVQGANLHYNIHWEQYVAGAWQSVPGAVGDSYEFTGGVGSYQFRAVLVAEDGTVQTASVYFTVEKPAAEEPAAEEPAAEEPEGQEPGNQDPAAEQPAAEQPAAEDLKQQSGYIGENGQDHHDMHHPVVPLPGFLPGDESGFFY